MLAREVPANFALTPARVSDVTMAHTMPVEADATYVFDLGYYDFSWWANLHESGCRIVTRLKSHTRPRVIAERAVGEGSAIKSDRIVAIDGRLKSARGRHHPLHGITLREIAVVIETGRTLRLLTNDLTSPAESVAALYKVRLQIELFFRWVKQHLKIKPFLGVNENAVRAQIAVALIAFLILSMAHRTKAFPASLLTLERLVRTNLMHRRPLENLHAPPPPINGDSRQTEIALC